MMSSSLHPARKWYLVFILLVELFLTSSSWALQSNPSRFERGVEKAVDKFHAFSQRHHNPTLFVDGNNVRGISKFEWDPIELQHRVSAFCQEFCIPRAVLVWDHGSCKFASPSTEMDMVILFSGLSRRADDVMVSEACQLVSSSFCEEWSSLAFVTNDAGLVERLRSKSMNHSTKVSDYKDTTGMPLIIDSTRFVELLSRFDSGPIDSKTDDNLAVAVKAAQASLRRFALIQKLGYNPRREKTWERCILAEALRRALTRSSPMGSHPTDSFSILYVQDLETRGYSNPSCEERNEKDDSATLTVVAGPPRLDKQQRRLLDRYNRALLKGKLDCG
jgi:hypothetical protein